MKKLITWSITVWLRPIPRHRLSLNLEDCEGPCCESGSSTNVHLGLSLVIGWTIPTRWFSFSVTNCDCPLPYPVGWLSYWRIHSRLILSLLVDGSRFISRTSLYMAPFIVPSMIWSLLVPPDEKQPHMWYFYLQTSLLVWCYWADVQSHFSSEHGVLWDSQKVQLWSHLTRAHAHV